MTLNGADREAERPPTSLRVLCFVAGLLLFLVAPVWLGTAYYVNVHAVPKQSNPVTPVVEVHDETGSFRDIGGRPLNAVLEAFVSRAPFTSWSCRPIASVATTWIRRWSPTRAQSSGVAKRGRLDLGEWVCNPSRVAR